MSAPFIFVSRSRIREGMLEDYKRYLGEFAEFVEANEPRVLVFEAYVSEDGTEVSGVQVHPDAESMEFHLQVAGERVMEAERFLELDSAEVYGTPSASLRQMLSQMADSLGVAVRVSPQHAGGMTRLNGG
jgi:hypothetical protein